MAKFIVTKLNGNSGEEINPQSSNVFIHVPAFPDENLRNEYIALEYFGDKDYDFIADLNNAPKYAFVQDTDVSGAATIILSQYPLESVRTLLQKQTGISLEDGGVIKLWVLTQGTYLGEGNISYVGQDKVFENANPLFHLKNSFQIERTHCKQDEINLEYNELSHNDVISLTEKLFKKDFVGNGSENPENKAFYNSSDIWRNLKFIVFLVEPSGDTPSNNLTKLILGDYLTAAVSGYEISIIPFSEDVEFIRFINNDEGLNRLYNATSIIKRYLSSPRVAHAYLTNFNFFDLFSGEIDPSEEKFEMSYTTSPNAILTFTYNNSYKQFAGETFTPNDELTVDEALSGTLSIKNFTYQHFVEINKSYIDLKGFFENNNIDRHLIGSGVGDVGIGYTLGNNTIQIPKTLLNEDEIFIDIIPEIQALYKENIIVNGIKNFGLFDIQVELARNISAYDEWQANNQGTIEQRKTRLILGSLGIAAGGAVSPIGGVAALFGVGLLGTNYKQQNDNYKNAPSSTSDILNSVSQLYFQNNYDLNIILTKSTDGLFLDYETSINNLGIAIAKNNVEDIFNFGEKQDFQFFKIPEIKSNLDLELSNEQKTLINDSFQEGMTFWFYRGAATWTGVKDYTKENPFIEVLLNEKNKH